MTADFLSRCRHSALVRRSRRESGLVSLPVALLDMKPVQHVVKHRGENNARGEIKTPPEKSA